MAIDRTVYNATVDDSGSNLDGTLMNKAEYASMLLDPIDGALADPAICECRLTLTSGLPITTADVTGATNVYITPYKGNRIALYCTGGWSGSIWAARTFTEITKTLGTLVNGQAYDLFAYDVAGVVTTELIEWANATITMTIAAPCVVTWTSHGMATGNQITFTTSAAGLPTGITANTVYYITVVDANSFKLSTTQANVAAGTFITTTGSQSGTHTGHQPQARFVSGTYAKVLPTQDGVPVKSTNGTTVDATRRYLGSFLSTSTTATEDSVLKRLLFNYYNQKRRPLKVVDTTDSWTYALNVFHQANASAANQVAVFVGVAEGMFEGTVVGAAANTSAGAAAVVAIGEDSTTVKSGVTGFAYTAAANDYVIVTGTLRVVPTVGAHAYLWLEMGSTTGTQTWAGDLGGVLGQTGLVGSWEC